MGYVFGENGEETPMQCMSCGKKSKIHYTEIAKHRCIYCSRCGCSMEKISWYDFYNNHKRVGTLQQVKKMSLPLDKPEENSHFVFVNDICEKELQRKRTVEALFDRELNK